MPKIRLDKRPLIINCGLVGHGLKGRETHEFPNLWCLHLYLHGLTAEIGEHSIHLLPGSLTVVPPGTRIFYDYHRRLYRHFFVHFRLPQQTDGTSREIALHRHLPEKMVHLLDQLRHIQRIWLSDTFHAETNFWGFLLDLTKLEAETEGASIRAETFRNKVEELIENALPDDLPVTDLAASLGVSPTHLNRRVKAEYGITTVQLIRRRRLKRAYHLLVHSTLPIKEIAGSVGIDDLQSFNKMIHREYGKSPRSLREESDIT